MIRRWAPIFIVVVLSLGLLWVTFKPRPPFVSDWIGKEMPDFKVETFNPAPRQKNIFRKSDIIGQVCIINFFASWCPACVSEHGVLGDLRRKYGVKIYGIAVKDRSDSLGGLIASHGDPFEWIGLDPTGRMSLDWKISGLPQTFIIDKNGVIQKHFYGAIDFGDIEKLLSVYDELKAK